jgi:hypothetical protein
MTNSKLRWVIKSSGRPFLLSLNKNLILGIFYEIRFIEARSVSKDDSTNAFETALTSNFNASSPEINLIG